MISARRWQKFAETMNNKCAHGILKLRACHPCLELLREQWYTEVVAPGYSIRSNTDHRDEAKA